MFPDLRRRELELHKEEASLILYQSGAIKFGDFTLSSGGKSPYYVDLRVLPAYPKNFDRITDFYVSLLRGCSRADRIVGVPTAGISLATIVSQKTGIPMAYVRNEERAHGLGKMIEGEMDEGNSVVLVDDLVTTGRSVIETSSILRRAGARVSDLICLIDREQGGRKRLEEEGIRVHSLLTVGELFKILRDIDLIGEDTYSKVAEYIGF
jgi:uridine monophosphate synthetase